MGWLRIIARTLQATADGGMPHETLDAQISSLRDLRHPRRWRTQIPDEICLVSTLSVFALVRLLVGELG
jgi:hypothetical protein